MFVFIDESGDPGMHGSVRHLVIALVIFETQEEVFAADESIRKLHITTNHKHEFKFSKCEASVRDSFFEEIRNHNFRVSAIVVNKDKLSNLDFKESPQKLYNFFLKKIIENSGLNHAKVRLDGGGSKQFTQVIRSYLRRGNDGIIQNFQFKDSKRDNLIQLADMVTGAIARSYKDKKDNNRWRGMLNSQKLDIWEFE